MKVLFRHFSPTTKMFLIGIRQNFACIICIAKTDTQRAEFRRNLFRPETPKDQSGPPIPTLDL